MSQSRLHSFIEAWTNILIGYGLNVAANFLIWPIFGWPITLRQNLLLGVWFTGLSLARSYTLRRLFNRWHQEKNDGQP